MESLGWLRTCQSACPYTPQASRSASPRALRGTAGTRGPSPRESRGWTTRAGMEAAAVPRRDARGRAASPPGGCQEKNPRERCAVSGGRGALLREALQGLGPGPARGDGAGRLGRDAAPFQRIPCRLPRSGPRWVWDGARRRPADAPVILSDAGGVDPQDLPVRCRGEEG